MFNNLGPGYSFTKRHPLFSDNDEGMFNHLRNAQYLTLKLTYSSHLKMDGLKDDMSLFRGQKRPIFRCLLFAAC